jgi:predicted nucleic acid-binding protein
MNGKFLLDTNGVIALLGGNANLAVRLQSANWVGITVITELEFLSFSNLSQADIALFQQFKNRVEVINLDTNDQLLIQSVCKIRQTYHLKLPDAIIAASAFHHQATLVTNDAIFSRVIGLPLQNF